MTRTKNDTLKPIQKIEISVTEILIAGEGSFKPYIQTFHYEPENIALASLGSVLGIFEIEDQSKDSAYIVNFLASIVKKEYFLHPKRAAIESLEATLHKINIALAELIKQDNTAWLGKLNATLCVFEKNNVHFSVSGKAKTLLVRGGILNDISDGLSEESDIHPLKTFTEVSSGRLKSADKIILTTPGLFEILSPEELQKSVQRFSNEKFSQFLKTALVNKLLFGSTIIIDIIEAKQYNDPVIKKAKTVEKPQDIPNAFSQSSFVSKPAIDPNTTIEAASHQTEIKETLSQDSEYTDSKTGHIYIQGDTPEVQPNETWIRIRWFLEDTLDAFLCAIKKYTNRGIRSIRARFEKQPKTTEIENDTEELPEADYFEETVSEESFVFDTPTPEYDDTFESTPPQEATVTPSLKERAAIAMQSIKPSENALGFIRSAYAKASEFSKKILPHFSTIKREFEKLTPKQKKYALGALFSIFVIPFIIIKFQGDPKTPPAPIQETAPVATPNPLAQDKNIHLLSSTQSVLTNNTVVKTLLLKDTLFAITKNSVINLKNPQDTQVFPLPETHGTVISQAAAMNDINTIFLLTNTGKIISFTPSNHVFTENKISLPNTSQITDVATYLTYLYILDDKSNVIHRYPRSDGGFGEASSWLKETVDIQKTDTMAINEDLYLSQNSQLLAFNKGKKDPIAFENTVTPIIFSNIFTQTDIQYLYVLDNVNGRLIQFEKSGAIVNQYAQDKIKEASALTVDEKNKQAYFTTPSEVFSIAIQ